MMFIKTVKVGVKVDIDGQLADNQTYQRRACGRGVRYLDLLDQVD